MTDKPEGKRCWWNAWIRSPRSQESHATTQQVRTVVLIAGAEGDPDLTSVFVMGGPWKYSKHDMRTPVIEQHGPVSYQAACQLRDDMAARLRADGNDVRLEIAVLD